MAESLLEQVPSVLPPLDRAFRPAALGNRAYQAAVAAGGGGERLTLSLERDAGKVSNFETRVLPESHPDARANFDYAERLLKFLLWQRGGVRVRVAGPNSIARRLAATYCAEGARGFDADFFAKVYDQMQFKVEAAEFCDLPFESSECSKVGGHLDGCRIGFDAGGSDRKVAALIDGKVVFSCEVPWEPKLASDPQYHIDGIDDSLRRAAAHLPQIDAIGVSSAGIYLNNSTRVASLFRSVPQAAFEARIRHIYPDLAKKWGGAPLVVANDGDVTALAGALELDDHSVLGIALGTSVAAGFVDAHGLLPGWLNELAFAPIDYASSAAIDREWSKDRGTAVNYFSQDAVIRLANEVGFSLPAGSPGTQLAFVQEQLELGVDPRPRQIFETVGVYLGYGLLQYLDFYPVRHVLLLGRVTSGLSGSILLEQVRRVLDTEAPERASTLSLHLPDEATRRVGQSIAAASLPPSRSVRPC